VDKQNTPYWAGCYLVFALSLLLYDLINALPLQQMREISSFDFVFTAKKKAVQEISAKGQI
jgi:hypothetical protein